jgi:hippurate hydrolase
MTSFLGTAAVLSTYRDHWQGTLLFIGQPAEERGAGAKALLADGLYTRFPKPDYVLALHVHESIEAGKIGYCPGYALANVDSVDITVRGIGGHGAYPHKTLDPIVLSAQIITALQTIVSRTVSPLDPAVVTVGSIHGGTKHNIIPSEVKLQLTVRTYKPEVRRRVLESIQRIVEETAVAAGIPDELKPTVLIAEEEFTPSTYNDPELTSRLAAVFRTELGEQNVIQTDPVMAGEDFARYRLEDNSIPSLIFWLGTVDPEKAKSLRAAGEESPPLHSELFAPSPEPTILTGIRGMTVAVLDLMGKK